MFKLKIKTKSDSNKATVASASKFCNIFVEYIVFIVMSANCFLALFTRQKW